jgi:hypothetical protein
MGKYLITYDLVGTDETSEDYKRLIEEIKSYSDYVKLQKSVWAVESFLSAAEIFDYLEPFIDSDDRLLVIEVKPSERKIRNPICGVESSGSFFSA